MDETKHNKTALVRKQPTLHCSTLEQKLPCAYENEYQTWI